MPIAVAVKAVALATAAVTGAAGIAWSATAGPAGPAASVWVDGPLEGFTVQPGTVTVTAHASDDAQVSRLVLRVDGKQVATDDQLERRGLLSLATFAWTAEPGGHSLVVRSDAASSEVVNVVVTSRGATPTPAAPVPVGSSAPSPTGSASPRPTQLALGGASPTAAALPTSVAGVPQPTATGSATDPSVPPSPTPRPTPSRTPSPTPAPVARPAYAEGSLVLEDYLYWDTNSGGAPCPQPHVKPAAATVTNATRVVIEVGGTAFTATASGTRWTASIDTSRISGAHNTGPLPVRVIASGPGGSSTSSAGSVTVYSCSKD